MISMCQLTEVVEPINAEEKARNKLVSGSSGFVRRMRRRRRQCRCRPNGGPVGRIRVILLKFQQKPEHVHDGAGIGEPLTGANVKALLRAAGSRVWRVGRKISGGGQGDEQAQPNDNQSGFPESSDNCTLIKIPAHRRIVFIQVQFDVLHFQIIGPTSDLHRCRG